MYRKERIAEQLRSFLAVELRGLHDPRLEFVTLTEVRVSNDYRAAKIFWRIFGGATSDPQSQAASFPSEESLKEVSLALDGAVKLLKRRIAEELELRHVPELTFVYDKSAETGSRIDELLKKAGF